MRSAQWPVRKSSSLWHCRASMWIALGGWTYPATSFSGTLLSLRAWALGVPLTQKSYRWAALRRSERADPAPATCQSLGFCINHSKQWPIHLLCHSTLCLCEVATLIGTERKEHGGYLYYLKGVQVQAGWMIVTYRSAWATQ